ncbi:transglutaminase-like domain-containing protein [Actinoplanes sichuanensis]|uniref:Transglutaminase-like domain-containing protein n=1 Tax=Actinoplanes sichuanensis TaxID=512349 RepID=A0ABW4AHA5_9ACTN|nr:transglutaminase-like domain-containing protein [Actinoplanes sichuanensis]BEL12002.1 transglutaminase-like domain-containing protein [Actinoplanes sichuanensis]
MDYTRQTRFSDPGRHLSRLAALAGPPLAAAGPSDLVAEVGAAVRNLVVHYRASGLDFPPDRLAEIDSRWVETMLDTLPPDQPLDEPRPAEQRIVGCCRDFTLLTVAALRARGIPARSRVGFADYFDPGFHGDHVITEFHDGTRWVAADTQLDPGDGFPVDVTDVPLGPGGLRPAAQCWLAFRRGEIDPETYGVGPGVPIHGPLMIRKYLLTELAHRYGDETLLWDFWGADAALLGDLGGRPLVEVWSDLPSWDSGEVTLLDEIAELLVAADAGDISAEDRLAKLYATDPRVHVGDTVTCHSPRGLGYDVDVRRPSPPAR